MHGQQQALADGRGTLRAVVERRGRRGERGLIHWSIPDPARDPGDDEQTLPALERTAAELESRIGLLIEPIKSTKQEVTERA